MDNFNVNIDLIRGHVDTIILRCLFDEDKYGLEILNYIKEKSDNMYCLKQPTLYSCLKRLEKIGYIKSYKGDTSNGAKRVYYTLLDEGRDFVLKDQYQWEYSRTIIDNLISDKKFNPEQQPPFNPSEFRPLTKRQSSKNYDVNDSDDELYDQDLPYSNNHSNSVENDEVDNFIPNSSPKNFQNIFKAIELGLNNQSLPEVETQLYNQISFEVGKTRTSSELSQEILAQKINVKTKEYDNEYRPNFDEQVTEFVNPTIEYQDKVNELFFDEQANDSEENNQNFSVDQQQPNNDISLTHQQSEQLEQTYTPMYNSNFYKNNAQMTVEELETNVENEEKLQEESQSNTNNYSLDEQLIKNGGMLFDNYGDYPQTSANKVNSTLNKQNSRNDSEAKKQSNNYSKKANKNKVASADLNDYGVNYIESFGEIYNNNQVVAPPVKNSYTASGNDYNYLNLTDLKGKLNEEGFNLKVYYKKNTADFFANKYYYKSKVSLINSLVFYFLFVLQGLVFYLATKSILPNQINLLIVSLTVPLIYPIYAFVKFLLNPKLKKTTTFNFKVACGLTMIFVVNVAIIVVCLAFLVFKARWQDVTSLINPLIAPLCMLLNFPLTLCSYQIMYASKKFNVQ